MGLEYKKNIKIYAKSLWLASLIFLLKRSNITRSPTDILFIHPSHKSLKLGRENTLVNELKKEGIKITEIVHEKINTILTKRLLLKNNLKSELPSKIYNYYASYLAEKYQPKVTITFRNGSPLSPYLKSHCSNYGETVHIAHSILSNQSSKFKMIDYGYYLVYGKSSEIFLNKLDNKIGSCKLVLSGSYLFNNNLNIEAAKPSKNILLLGIGPDYENKKEIIRSYQIIKEWIATHTDYTLHVKPHIRSKSHFWKEVAKKYNNIAIFDARTPISDCLKVTSTTLAIYTNAVLDSALTGRPTILVCENSIKDYLEVERFFTPRCKSVRELEDAIRIIENNFESYRRKAFTFADYHLEYKQDSLEFIVETIYKIYRGDSVDHKII